MRMPLWPLITSMLIAVGAVIASPVSAQPAPAAAFDTGWVKLYDMVEWEIGDFGDCMADVHGSWTRATARLNVTAEALALADPTQVSNVHGDCKARWTAVVTSRFERDGRTYETKLGEFSGDIPTAPLNYSMPHLREYPFATGPVLQRAYTFTTRRPDPQATVTVAPTVSAR